MEWVQQNLIPPFHILMTLYFVWNELVHIVERSLEGSRLTPT